MKTIIIKNVSKTFRIGVEKKQTTLARVLSTFSNRESKRTLQVLKNVSFSAEKGEIVGIIGRNGSGKSTLLKIIAGIIDKDEGIIETKGKIISLINLDSGIRDRLKMKDNIYLGCTLFGLNRKEIRKRFKSIVEFAELKDFVSTRWYQLSDGMKQRVIFSIAIHSNPEILLLDEIFEVGDEEFRRKCLKKMKELTKKGVTTLIVSHQSSKIAENCNKVIWIDKGKIVMSGNSLEVIEVYLKDGRR